MKKVILFLILLAGILLWGQEIYTISNDGSGDYESFNDAIGYVNGLETIPAGGVIFNIASDQVFAENPPEINAIGTETDQIIFQKEGEGTNPVIENTENVESMLYFNGAAWITFDGINLADTTPEDTIRFEKAAYVFASDHITVQNCEFINFDKYGVHVRDASTNTVIDNNELYYTADYYTTQATVYCIYAQYNSEADNVVISNNSIYGIKEASATIYGIRVWKINADVYNNFISLPDDNNDKIYALRMDGGLMGLVMDIQYNTVYLGGLATDNSYCFYRTGTDGLMNVQNNIFINNRTGDFNHLIYDYTFISGDWNADHNAYYTENGRLGDWGDTECVTLEDWQTATEGDANSVYKNVEFVGGYDLHIAGASLGDIDLAAMPLAEIATDIDGELRAEEFPYMGADENVENPLGAPHTYGDVDDNGNIDAFDASLIIQYIVDIDPEPEAPLPWEGWRLEIADVDDNGEIGSYDAALILQYIVLIIDQFPAEGTRFSSPEAELKFNQKDDELIINASEDLYSLTIEITEGLNKISSIETAEGILSALNLEAGKIAIASAEKITGNVIRIKLTEAGNITLNCIVNSRSVEKQIMVEPFENSAPQVTMLQQNSPNPFNPETVIAFSISEPEGGELKIYNLKGQEIVSNSFAQGSHRYVWDSTNYGSGIYFYRLQSGTTTISRKMTLLK